MKNDKYQLNVVVKKRDGLVYKGPAWAVSSTNEIGPFDVLPMHANLIAVIKEKLTIHLKEVKKDVEVERGIMWVKENNVEVYIGV